MEEKICFPELPEEYEILFRRYIEEFRHLQEIIQLYQMMLFDLDEIFSHYRLNFDDTVISVNGEVIDRCILCGLYVYLFEKCRFVV